ncbi:MAG: 5'/3'-nucleotidase SurE [Rhodobacteraceae bacterium]|nr:5'/3'-nucleotidase SurE [Paracoccaceae bacterium]
MRILLTNDDGINAPGLQVLEAIAADIAGPDGEVWVVAPAFEQSGVGHCISYTHPMMISQMGTRRFATEGSPADCVLAGLHHVMPERPDLVLSGVNRGNNAAENTLYSGTICAAIEATLQGIPAIALSQFYGPDNASLDNPFDAAAVHGAGLIRDMLDKARWDADRDYRLFYNVNFPPVAADAVKGRQVVAQGWRHDTNFGVEPHSAPSGRQFLWIKGGPQHIPTDPGTDVAANLDGYISVTPMRCDLTAHDALADIAEQLG